MSVEDQAQAEEQAAFESSFGEASAPVKVEAAPVEAAPAEVKVEEAAPSAPTPEPGLSADEITTLRAAVSRMPELETSLRKANGRIGELNDKLLQAAKSKEAEGKPAALTKVELKRMKEEFPELAQSLGEDLSEAISALQGRSQDPQAMTDMVQGMLDAQRNEMQSALVIEREDAVTDLHPGWKAYLTTPEFAAWTKTLPAAELNAFELSKNPHFVAKKLDQFKDWQGKQAKGIASKQKSQERLNAALTPTGVARAGQATISDNDAEQQAFIASFNT